MLELNEQLFEPDALTETAKQPFKLELRNSLFEWADVKDHAHDRRHADQEENERRNQRE